MRLLVVGFEARVVRGLRRGLVAAGHHVVARRRGGESLVDGPEARFDALLLDGALADGAGLAWLAALRGRGLTTAVVFVVADAPVATRVAALRAGRATGGARSAR